MLSFLLTLRRFVRVVALAVTDPQLRRLTASATVLLATGTAFYRGVEGWSALDALYFSVATLTTVGYGDLSPTTAFGKVFTILYILGGVGLLVGLVDAVAERAVDRPLRWRLRRSAQEGGPETAS